MAPGSLEEQLELAEEAYQKFDYAEALNSYKQALGIINRQSGAWQTDKRWTEVNFKIVDTLDRNGKWLDALMYVGTLLNTANITNNHQLKMDANLVAGKLLIKRGKWEDAKKKFLQTIEASKGNTTSPIVAECHYGLAIVDWRIGEIDKSVHNAKQAMELAQNDTVGSLRAKCLVLLASIHHYQGNHNEAMETFKSAIDLLSEKNEEEELGRAYNNLGEVYKSMGDLDSAIEQYDKCVEVSQRSNIKRTELYGIANSSECLARQGNLSIAQERLVRLKELLKDVEERNILGNSHLIEGLIAYKGGDTTKSLAEYEIALQMLKKIGDQYDIGNLYLDYGKTYEFTGQKDQAMVMYEKAKECFAKIKAKHADNRVDQFISDLREKA